MQKNRTLKNSLLKEYVNGNPSARKYLGKSRTNANPLHKIKRSDDIFIQKEYDHEYTQPYLSESYNPDSNQNYVFISDSESVNNSQHQLSSLMSDSIIEKIDPYTNNIDSDLLAASEMSPEKGFVIKDNHLMNRLHNIVDSVHNIDSDLVDSLTEQINDETDTKQIESIKSDSKEHNTIDESTEIKLLSRRLDIYEDTILFLTSELQKCNNNVNKLISAVQSLQSQLNMFRNKFTR